LDVPADYISGNHTLRLTGEALFDVVHSKDVPFTVWAGTTSVRVLGTTFLVRRYTSDRQTKVVVRSGKVAVGSIVLTGGRLIEVGDGKNWHTGPADPAPFSFVMGTLTLAEMSLAQAIPELDRWYDADIRLGDSTLGERHIVGEFRAGSLADVQAILTMTFNVRVVRDGRTLTIFQK
jgi:transmembrane sensor